MKCLILLIFLIPLPEYSIAQDLSPQYFGFERNTIENNKLGKVNYYLSIDSTNNLKPLLVYLDGSGAFPLFQTMGDGQFSSTVVFDFNMVAKDYTILLISKPGVPFIDKVDIDPNGFTHYEEPAEYKKKLSLDWRAESADLIINNLLKERKVDSLKIIVLGFSEGAQVGPVLAKKNKHISHLLLFGGNGLNQLFDPILNARMRASNGQISEIESQEEIDSLFIEYKKIYNDPESVDKNWWGHTYKRWSSFTQIDPYRELIDLSIPIYIANGSLDENSVLSADYIQLEFIKNKKSNLTYKTYPNYDHQFNEIIFENGEFKDAIPKIDLVLNNAFDWLKEQ